MGIKDRVQAVFERVARPREKLFDEFGREKNSGIPMAPPIGHVAKPSMIDIVREQIRGEHLRLQALSAGYETFEEADDFEVEDDYDPSTPYEEVFDPVDYEVRNRLRNEEFAASVQARLDERNPKQEIKDGSTSPTDKGRDRDTRGGSGHADTEPKGKSKPKQDATNERSVANADRGNREVEE